MIKRVWIFLILSILLVATPVKWSMEVTAEAGPKEEEEKKEKEEEKEEKEEKEEEKKEDLDKEKEEESTKEPRESEEEDPKDNKETNNPDNSDEQKESPNNETNSGNTSNEQGVTNTNQTSGQNATGETETRETTSSNETNSSLVTEVHREVQEEVEEVMVEEVPARTPRNQDPGRFHPYGNYWDEGYDRSNDSPDHPSIMDDAYTKIIMELYYQYKDELNLLDQDIFIFIRTILDGNNLELEEMIKLLDEEFLAKMWNFITKDEMLDLAQTDLLLEFFSKNYNVTLSTVDAFITGDREGTDHSEKEQRAGIIGTIVNFFKSIGLFFTNLF